MNPSIYNVSLDIHKTISQTQLNIVEDDNARRLIITLYENGKPYHIAENCYAKFKAEKPSGAIIYNNCTIEDNNIIYDLTDATSEEPGIVECAIELLFNETVNGVVNVRRITSPRFTLLIGKRIYSNTEIEGTNEFTALEQALAEVDNLDISATKVLDVATVTVTKKDGTSQSVNIFDGADGQDGKDGTNGKDGKDGVDGRNGIDGKDGVNGVDGKDGTDGITPDISATATVDNSTGTPSVTVTKSGDIASPTFAFAFSNLKGDKGNNGTTPDMTNYYTKAETQEYVSGATDNFITKAVSDLTNYYLKSETYTRAEVQTLIAQIQTAHSEIVQELPATGESNVIYLVPRTTTELGNIYDEYVYITASGVSAWEKIGSTDIDLTGYATETWVNTQIANFLTQSQVETIVNTALTNYYTKTQTDTLLQGKADINSILPYIDYTISNNEVTITNLKYDKTKYSDGIAYIINIGHYTIPDIIEGSPVRYIKQGAFSRSNVKIDKFPATLKEIGVGNIDSGTVTYYSDLPTNVAEYTIYSVTTDEVGHNKGRYQYFNDTWNRVSYDVGAFSNKLTMTNLVIPEGTTKIGNRSFLYGNNVTVYIPASVTTIEHQAFGFSSTLTAAIIDSTVVNGFQACLALTTVKLNNINTETISNQAFSTCTSLASIILPKKVKTIGTGAFSSCSSLASVNIPNGVTSIGSSAFANTALTSIYLPKNVSLGTNAFQNVALTDVYYGGSQSEWQAHLSDRGYAQIDNISGVTIHYNQEYAKVADILGYHDSTKQNVTDNNLTTTNKNIVPAINEVNSIAKGTNQAISYASYSAMVTAINAMSADALNAGQNIMIQTLEVPDLWVYSVESTSVTYTYTTDSAFTTALDTDGYVQVGYYKLSALETQKVDLTDYYDKTATDNLLAYKLTEPSSGLAVGKYFRVASIDADGHAVLECIDAPTREPKTGATAPTTSTVADYVGQLYTIDNTPNTFYICVKIANNEYTWRRLFISNDSRGAVNLGGATTNGESPNVVIGLGCGVGYSIYTISIGQYARAHADYSVAIGPWANATTASSIQLGSGTNNAAETLQFRTYRLLEKDGTIPPERITSQNWTDAQRLAVLQSLGCTVDENGYVKWTATPSA